MTNESFIGKVRWVIASLVLAVTIVTLYAQEPAVFTRGINVTQGNVVISRGYLYSGGAIVRDYRPVTTISTAGAATYTAAQVLGGLITRTPGAGGNVTDVLPTAANLIAALPNVVTGTAFHIYIDLDATPGGTVTLNGASTGVTYSSGCSTAIGTSDVMDLLITVTSATTYRAVCLNGNT